MQKIDSGSIKTDGLNPGLLRKMLPQNIPLPFVAFFNEYFRFGSK